MAEHVYINTLSNKGKIGINQNIFDVIVTNTLEKLQINRASKQMRKNQRFKLNRPIRTTIHKGIVHVWVAVDVSKKVNLQETTKKIQDEIVSAIIAATDQVPFDVQVKVESLI